MGKTIEFDLSSAGLGKAIRDYQRFRMEFLKKCDGLIQKLTDKGVEVAKMTVAALGKVYSGELQNSISGFFDTSSRTGIIRAGAWYAVYVEYGTGVVGAANPHPSPEGWVYDVGGHGAEGWTYYNPKDGKFHHTTGEPSAPFMYSTMKELENLCGEIAQEVFGA